MSLTNQVAFMFRDGSIQKALSIASLKSPAAEVSRLLPTAAAVGLFFFLKTVVEVVTRYVPKMD